MSDQDVSVLPRFERFPATIKGAFVIHGEDGDPHQVALTQARVVSVGGSTGETLAMPPAVVNVPPRQDMFVPFEFSLTELAAGWYGLECDITVDGAPRTVGGGKRFLINWPRSTTRRGPIDVKAKLAADPVPVTLESLDCSTDRATLRYSASEPLPIRLLADGHRLPELSATHDEGRGVIEFYPLLREHSDLRIELARRDGPGIDFRLP